MGPKSNKIRKMKNKNFNEKKKKKIFTQEDLKCVDTKLFLMILFVLYQKRNLI